MGEIINLRLARKRKQRTERETVADQNRAIHGRTKSERLIEDTARRREFATHEAHRRETPDGAEHEE